MKKITLVFRIILPVLLLVGLLLTNSAEAVITSTFTDTETVPNLSADPNQDAVTVIVVDNVTPGNPDQDATTATTVANVEEVKASQTLTVGALPANATFVVIGICAVVFTNGAGVGDNSGAVDDTDCTGDATINNYTATNPGVTRTQAEIATALQSLTNVSDAAHGALTVGVSGTDASFTTTNTESSSTIITFTDNTGGDITSVAVTGVIPVAQENTITIGGTPEEGDVFTATLPTVGAVNYTVLVTDTTNDLIAAGLNGAIQASAGYAGQDFTSGVATNVITLTAKVAGTGFVQTSGAVDRVTSQVNEITISGTVEEDDVFTATLPVDGDVNYTVLAGDTTTDDIAIGLNNAIQASGNYGVDFTSGVSGSVITLTAATPGTEFVQTSGTTNRTAIAQEVTFTPASVTAGETFIATINGTDYEYLATAGNGVPEVVAALAPIIDADADVDCTEDTFMITCTASVAGTPFTYAADVVDVTPPVISALSFTPDTGTAKIGDVITLNITSDQVGYSAGAITVNGEAVAAFTDLGAGLYSVTYTVVGGDDDQSAGSVPASVVLDDGDGNSNTAYTTVAVNTLAIDANAPTRVSGETTSTTTIDLTFSEDLNGTTITNADFAVPGFTLGTDAFEISPGVVRLTVTVPFATSDTPDVDYTGSVTDLAGNSAPNFLAFSPDDGVAPELSETIAVPTPDNDATPDYTFSTTEDGAITVGGDCSLGATPATTGANTITFNPLADSTYSNCTITVTDSSTNASTPLAVSSFTVDTTPPDVVLSTTATDPTNVSPIAMTATFSEDVTGFIGPDIDVVNGNVTLLTPVSGSVYNFNVVPVTQGLVTVYIDASKALDTAGNANTAATPFEITYDSVPPVITLLGTSPVNIEYGETYVDDGATALDTNDGDVTGSIVTVDPVDTSVLGTYTVTYNVSDSAGNAAEEVTRTVNVIQRAITVTASTDSKEYDGTTDSSFGIPTITSGSLAFGDSENFTQTYDNENVGTGKTLTPAGTVDDGNGGNNYNVTFVPDTTGEITEKTLTVSATGINKVYDGTIAATVTLSDDRIAGDDLTPSYTDAEFDDPNVATDITVYVSGISISGPDAGNYIANTDTDTTADITALDITGSFTADNKVYDGNTDAAVLTQSLTGVLPIDDGNVELSGGTASFADSNVGTWTVTESGMALSGSASGNYNLTGVDTTTADITALEITVTPNGGQSKIYGDADPAFTYTFDPALIGVDDFSGGLDRVAGETVGTYAYEIGTLSAGSNYTLTLNLETFEITLRNLTITAEGIDKVYDGTTTAAVTFDSDEVLGDDVVITDTGATFEDKNVGADKTVTANFTLSGADLGNYTATASPVETTADITAKDLTVSATGIDKTYDNTTTATVTLSDDRVSGDELSTSYTSASFANDGVGTDKPVSVVGISISGTDAGNYNLLNTTADTTADINSPSSGGGSSGSRPASAPITTTLASTPTTNVPGEVLGAEKFVFTQFMKVGARGTEVMELQKLLNTLGYNCGLADGIFGPKTKACVVRFQQAHPPLVADGIVGPLTRAVLNQ